MSYEVKVFYKTGGFPESFDLESQYNFVYESGMLMLTDTKGVTTHIPQSDIERVEIEEIKEEAEKEVE